MTSNRAGESSLLADLALFESTLIGVCALFTRQLRLPVYGGKVALVGTCAIVRTLKLLELSDRTRFAVGHADYARVAASIARRTVPVCVAGSAA